MDENKTLSEEQLGFDMSQMTAFIEQAKSDGELNEEDLDTVSGGWTQNRYDPAACKPDLGRTRYECLGFLCWCDHLRVENDVGTIGGGTKLSRYICDMGAFNYIGGNAGQPV